MTDRIGVLGSGSYTPSRVMTNADWSALIDTTDEWIVTRTGIHERRFAADDETTLDLAANAAEKALADAGLTADDLDEIIVASDTPEVYTPDTAAYLQHRLGAREITAYDLGGSGCAGFVLALDIAKTRVQAVSKRILVVGVELISRLMNWTDRATCVLFGDAAGAVVIGSGAGVKAELLAVTAGTDGRAAAPAPPALPAEAPSNSARSWSPRPTTTAPAASPKSTQVDRSFQSINREISSTPTTRIRLAAACTRVLAMSRASTNPAHPEPPRS